MKHYVYVFRSIPTGRYYIGMTADVNKRLEEHNTKKGRWTSSFAPWRLAGFEEFGDRVSAARRERYLKGREGIAERQALLAQLESGAENERSVERP